MIKYFANDIPEIFLLELDGIDFIKISPFALQFVIGYIKTFVKNENIPVKTTIYQGFQKITTIPDSILKILNSIDWQNISEEQYKKITNEIISKIPAQYRRK